MASRTTAKKTNRKTATKGVAKPSSKDAKPPSLRGRKAPPKQPAPDLRSYDLEEAVLGTNQTADLMGTDGAWFRHKFLKQVDAKILLGPNAVALGPLIRGIVSYYRNMIRAGQANRRTSVADIRAAKAARHLLETDNVVELFTQNHTGLRAELEGIPAMVTRDLELRKKIQDAHNAAFKRWYDRMRRQLEKEDVDT